MSVTSSSAAQNLLRQRDKDKRKTLEDSLREVFATQSGREVFRWLLSSHVCALTSNVYVEGSDRTVFLEGRRSVGVDILSALEQVTPGAYATLVASGEVAAKSDRAHEDAARVAAGSEDDG